MEEVTYQGLTFEPYIRREEIAKQVRRLAQEIKRLRGQVNEDDDDTTRNSLRDQK